MSCEFRIRPGVQEEINKYPLQTDEKQVLTRCVGGYSKPQNLNERINKLHYRLSQCKASYPDWKQSAKMLDTRKVELIVKDNGNPNSTIIGNILWAPFAVLGYALEDSGTTKLQKLIKANN